MDIRFIIPSRFAGDPVINQHVRFLESLGHSPRVEAAFIEFPHPYFCAPSLFTTLNLRALAGTIASHFRLTPFDTADGTKMKDDGRPDRLLLLDFHNAILNLPPYLLDPDGNY